MNKDKFADKLMGHNGARIAEKELRLLLSIPDYDEYYHVVCKLIEHDNLSPVKHSGSNGMRPPLHKRYTIKRQAEGCDHLLSEIRLLQGCFNIEGYLADAERYVNHRYWVLIMDDFFKNHSHKLDIAISVNERSFQIFQREKALREDGELAAVLNFNPSLRDALNFYDTPEPFFIYNIHPLYPSAKDELNVLIVENKDTWYTLRGIMKPDKRCIAGICFDSLIYGEGRKITRRKDSLTEFERGIFKGAKISYHYFGDLDYEGMGIAHDLIAVNQELNITLMKQLYIAMLEAADRDKLPISREKQNKKAAKWFVSMFDEAHSREILSILEDGRYIPQEILNKVDFTNMVGSLGM